jgi:hypothetical protein
LNDNADTPSTTTVNSFLIITSISCEGAAHWDRRRRQA